MKGIAMREEIISCDTCGEGPALPVSVVVGRKTDAAGSPDDIVVIVDLCHQHAIEALDENMNSCKPLTGREFAKRWKKLQ